MESISLYVLFFALGAGITAIIALVMLAVLKNMIKTDFALIANNTIKNEQEDLRKQNREVLEEKLKPLTKELTEFKQKIENFNLSGVENTAKIISQLNIMEKNNKLLESEAKNLTEALTKNQNIKGAYGEEILDTILQNSGLQEGIHYIKQYASNSESSKDNNIHKIRPDIIINLPDGKSLIIDSKVTLSSYLEYVKDNSKLKDFKSEVKKRIVDLSNKNYQKADGLIQPDFVLMYMPIDASVSLLYEDAELIETAYKSNIIITGTASLLVAIRLVNQLFSQQKQNENVMQIVKAGTNLFETFVQFSEELIQIQKNMDNISSQLKTAVNRFSRANKNKPGLFSQINELKNCGINTTKEIPQELLQNNIYNTEEEVLSNG